MIVVDSSALIEYYRPTGSPVVRSAVAEAIKEDRVTVNGIIHVEVVAFASSKTSFLKLDSDFRVFHWLDLQESEFDCAAELGFFLRRKAITVPAPDLIIAASAIRANLLLYHADSHYDVISQHCGLRSRNLRP
jgi:predicted nucleic acid-binding protein